MGAPYWRGALLALVVVLLTPSGASATAPSVPLSESERAWLERRTFVRGVEEGWMPFSFRGHGGRVSGIGVDYWGLIRERLRLREDTTTALPFNEILEGMRAGAIDLYPITTRTADREAYAVFSEPYAHFPVAIAAPRSKGYIFDAAALEGRVVAVGEDYSAYHLLAARYPEIDFLQVRHTPEALKRVAAGAAFAAVDILPVLQYQVDQFDYLGLRVAGVTDVQFPLQVMVHREHARLVPLLNRAIADIGAEERIALHRKWMLRDVVPTTDYALLWQVLAAAAVVLALILYWNRKLVRSRTALRDSQARYQRLVDDIGPHFVIYSHRPDGALEYVSKGSTAIFGVPPEEAVGRSFADIVPWRPGEVDKAWRKLEQMMEHGDPGGRWEMRFERADGSIGTLLVTPHPVAGAGNTIERVEGIIEDITERKGLEHRLQMGAQVFQHAREGIVITDAEANITDVNAAFSRITGYSREEVLGRNPRVLKSGHHDARFYEDLWTSLKEAGYWSGEIWNRRKDGAAMAEFITISRIADEQGVTRRYIGLFSDITDKKQQERRLEYLARYDALTALPNRVLLADRLQLAMAQSQRRGARIAVVFIDLDGFKQVNDAHGHAVGDQLLVALAKRFRKLLRKEDTIARIGGDEFVAVLGDLTPDCDALPLLERLLSAAARPVAIDGVRAAVSASIGVTFYPQEQAIDGDQLLRQADQAMFRAKEQGKNRYEYFRLETAVPGIYRTGDAPEADDGEGLPARNPE